MRLDKYLKVSRLVKRRTVANELCAAGRVTVNGRTAKPGLPVKAGDIIHIRFGAAVTGVRIREVREQVRKEEAATLFDLLPPQQEQNP